MSQMGINIRLIADWHWHKIQSMKAPASSTWPNSQSPSISIRWGRHLACHRNRWHLACHQSRRLEACATILVCIITGGLVLVEEGAAQSNRAVPAPSNQTKLPTHATPSLLVGTNILEALAARREQQITAAKGAAVFHGFTFTDRVLESGILFEHHPVDDAGRFYKAVHYDHGNALAVADVDGDGLLDIYFTTQLGTNQLWRNLGGGKFADITAQAGVGLPNQISVGASFADIDNDGYPDLYVTTVRHGNHLFKNLGGGRFRNLTHEAGLDYSGHSSGAVFFDFDGDGLLDLFLCNVGIYTTNQQGRGGYYIGLKDAFSGHLFPERTEYCILYKNMGSLIFKDVTREMGLRHPGWVGDATFTDLNQDGFPDLYVLNMQGRNHYYENLAGKGFVDKTAAYFPKTPWGAMGIKFFDWNQDGLLDLFITDMHSDMTYAAIKISETSLRVNFEKQKSEAWCTAQYNDTYWQGASNCVFGNAFYQNQGHGVFTEISDQIGAETFWPWGISVGDLNADGYEDVFVASGMGLGFRYGVNSVLLNEGGRRLLDSEFLLGVEPRRDRQTRKIAFELDCSGVDKESPFCAGQSGRVSVYESFSSRSSAIFDLDNDGDLDLVTLELDNRPQVLISNLAEKKAIHYLKVKLVGTRSNQYGLGATVKVTAGGKTLTQFHDGKSGYFAQSAMPLYFGLGEAVKVDRIEVRWPSRKSQILTQDLPMNKLLTIAENP